MDDAISGGAGPRDAGADGTAQSLESPPSPAACADLAYAAQSE